MGEPVPSRPQTIAELLAPGSPPRVIAHRGFSGKAPENTLSAFREAVATGADMIELDVVTSRDGELVVIHDEHLDRTTSASGLVRDLDLRELRSLDAGSWFAAEYSGERIPTLAEVLEACGRDILINVEIKKEAVTARAEGGIADRVTRCVREHGLSDRVILSSFEPLALEQARTLDASIARASLYGKGEHAGRRPLDILNAVDALALHISSDDVDTCIVEECRSQEKPVFVFTVNETDEMRRFLDMGVSGFFTDWPDRGVGMRG